MSAIKVVMAEPGKPARVTEIGTSLEELQEAVGGYIEVFYPFPDAGLECKTVSAWSADKWKSLNTIPEIYILQCQHYMAVMGFDYMYLAGLILGSGFVYYKIEKDEELIQNLITAEKS